MLLTYGYKKLSIAKNVYMNSGFQISSTKVCSNSNTMSVNKMYWIHWNIRFVVQYYNDNHYNTMFSPVSELILCVWTDLVQRFVCVCVCVCMYVCMHTHIYVHSPWRLHLSRTVGMSGNRSTMLCWRHFFSPPSLLIITLE